MKSAAVNGLGHTSILHVAVEASVDHQPVTRRRALDSSLDSSLPSPRSGPRDHNPSIEDPALGTVRDMPLVSRPQLSWIERRASPALSVPSDVARARCRVSA